MGNFIAIGLNYADHARETGAAIPAEPIIFNKAPSCLSGPNDDVVIPKDSKKTDWEVELAVIIGKGGSYIDEAKALSHVAGYAVCHDVSEREFQIERGGQWTKGKGCPTFGPLGPWLVTPERDQECPGARHVPRRQRQAHADRQHQHDDLQRRVSGELSEPLHARSRPGTSSPPARRPASAPA